MSGSEPPPFDFVKFFQECHLWFCFLLFAFLPKEACFQYAAFPIQTVHSQSSFFLSCQPAFNSIGLIFSYPLRYLLIKYRIFFYCLRIVHFLLNIVCCYFYPFLIGSFSSLWSGYWFLLFQKTLDSHDHSTSSSSSATVYQNGFHIFSGFLFMSLFPKDNIRQF